MNNDIGYATPKISKDHPMHVKKVLKQSVVVGFTFLSLFLQIMVIWCSWGTFEKQLIADSAL